MSDTPADPPAASLAQPPAPRRRAAPLLLSLLMIGGAAAASWTAAEYLADALQDDRATRMRATLSDAGFDWVTVRADGLVIRLTGTAPDEVTRFRVLTAAGSVVDDRQIRDEIRLAKRDMLQAPDFSLRLLRQGDEVSLIGLIPAASGREGFAKALSQPDLALTDMTGTAAFPAPEGWTEAMDYGLRAAALIEQGTVAVSPGRVAIEAVVATPDDKPRLEAALRNAAPAAITPEISVTAPLPVIAPYALRFQQAADAPAELTACAADTEQARDQILSAAEPAGAKAECPLGIGAPAGWVQAATAGIKAAQDLGDATLEITDRNIRLTAGPDVATETLATARDGLAAKLPAGWVLNVSQAEMQTQGPALFTAEITEQGEARLSGVLPDETMRQTVQSLARAQIGATDGTLTLDPSLPAGWAPRVMAGLDAMGLLERGELTVTGEEIRLSGVSGDALAPEKAIAALADRLGAGAEYSLSISYGRLLDPDITLPSGALCVDRLNAVLLQSQIGFEPGGAGIVGDVGPMLDELRPILADCADYRIEIAGHTDAQGGDDSNLKLSRARATALLDRLRDEGLSVANIVANGYGETRPVAENDTEEGREANRRIEVTLLAPDPVAPALPAAPELRGHTPTPEAAAASLERAAAGRNGAADGGSHGADAPDLPALPGTLSIPLPGTETLAPPPVIEPPATVLNATPDTPRPAARPEDAATDTEAP